MRLLKILTLTLLLAPVCHAQDSLALAEKLLEIENTQAVMQNAFETTFKTSLDRMKAQGAPQELVDQIHALADKFYADNFKWDSVKPQLAQLYVNAFSTKELADIVAFYETPTGKKAIAVMPTLFNQGSALAMAQIKGKLPEFQQKVVALIQAYQVSHPQSTSAPATSSTPAPATPSASPTRAPITN